jgi:hypothetical protein
MPAITHTDPDRPAYPHVRVRLSGTDGNVFMLIGRVSAALRRLRAATFAADTTALAAELLAREWVQLDPRPARRRRQDPAGAARRRLRHGRRPRPPAAATSAATRSTPTWNGCT